MVRALPEKLLRTPFWTVTSSAANPLGASLKVKVTVAVSRSDYTWFRQPERVKSRYTPAHWESLVTDNWLVREARALNRAPWHHDGPYFDLDGTWCVLWMGLEPVGPGEGVVFLRGSHRWDRHFMPESFAGLGPKGDIVEPYERTPDFGRDLDRYDPIEFSLDPGDCLYFDRLTVHGAPNPAPPTRSLRRFTLRFAESTARYRPRGPWTKDMTDYLEANYSLTEGGPYSCELLPILWRSADEKTRP